MLTSPLPAGEVPVWPAARSKVTGWKTGGKNTWRSRTQILSMPLTRLVGLSSSLWSFLLPTQPHTRQWWGEQHDLIAPRLYFYSAGSAKQSFHKPTVCKLNCQRWLDLHVYLSEWVIFLWLTCTDDLPKASYPLQLPCASSLPRAVTQELCFSGHHMTHRLLACRSGRVFFFYPSQAGWNPVSFLPLLNDRSWMTWRCHGLWQYFLIPNGEDDRSLEQAEC